MRPLLLRKAIATTLISAVIMVLGYGAWALGLISGIFPTGLIPPR
jgi:predicted secreted protein